MGLTGAVKRHLEGKDIDVLLNKLSVVLNAGPVGYDANLHRDGAGELQNLGDQVSVRTKERFSAE